jgi:hypothetical protein
MPMLSVDLFPSADLSTVGDDIGTELVAWGIAYFQGR